MTISYVSSAAAEATSVSMPSHQAGDLLVIVAFNNTGTTIPTAVNGWYIHRSSGTSSKGSIVGYKIATSGSETSGTWTNASFVSVAVYRDNTNYIVLGYGANAANSASTTINFPAVTGRTLSGSNLSWYIGFCGVGSNSTDNETAPTGMTNRVSLAGASSGEVAIHDTNGAVASWSSTNRTSSGSVAYHTQVLEILDTGKAISAAGGGGPLIGGRLVR